MSLSKFLGASMPYNCYEIGHTWTPHCSQAWLDVWYNTFTRALRLYGLLYLVGQLVARRHGARAFMQTFWSAFDSSMFLSQNFFIYLALVCTLRRLTGRLHLMQSTLVCGFVSSACAITIERPASFSFLYFFLQEASEIIYRMLRSRGFVRDIPYFEVAMFALSLGGYIYYARHLIGKEELVGNDQLEAKLALKEAVLLQPPCDVDKLVRMCDVTPITETLITCNGSGHIYGYKATKVNGQVTASTGAEGNADGVSCVKRTLFDKAARDHNWERASRLEPCVTASRSAPLQLSTPVKLPCQLSQAEQLPAALVERWPAGLARPGGWRCGRPGQRCLSQLLRVPLPALEAH
ncbi:hypothetical protein HPB48_024447 [Haemaphysalis longicornis]|uniref:Transmembrane protein 135 N-terminal domain-containing protein n=1 Tax=Haemaphysalis longicornis TaxID=44386 RepID=A0A9J6GY35_HAELO|nr:hypothetical protein HPB48_024447 [Haemaphysalis longicornis]